MERNWKMSSVQYRVSQYKFKLLNNASRLPSLSLQPAGAAASIIFSVLLEEDCSIFIFILVVVVVPRLLLVHSLFKVLGLSFLVID